MMCRRTDARALLLLICLGASGAAGSRDRHLTARVTTLTETTVERVARENELLDESGNPVSRLLNVLESMKETLEADAADDKERHAKMSEWCKSNEESKSASIKEGQSKTKQLKATIEELTAKSTSLKAEIEEAEASVKEEKDDLAMAVEVHEKEASASHDEDLQRTQNIQQLKNAIRILSKHHKSALPQLTVALVQEKVLDHKGPFGPEHESDTDRSLDSFLSGHGFDGDASANVVPLAAGAHGKRFLQQAITPGHGSSGLVQSLNGQATQESAEASEESSWSASDLQAVRTAFRVATSFAQAKYAEFYTPEYKARSGEIFGILKQMLEGMEADAKEAAKAGIDTTKNFEELRTAKKEQIAAGEKLAEDKEDSLSQTDIDLVQAKEDLKETATTLSEDEKFLANLKTTCKEAKLNYGKREEVRSAELAAVSETLAILSTDEAKKAMEGTYKSFIQVASVAHRLSDRQRHAAARLLRIAAAKGSGDTGEELALLAASVQLDAFTKVKKAVNTLIAALKKQQADEVKKHDWCTSELQENEMAVLKERDNKKRLVVTIAELESKIEGLANDIKNTQGRISDLQVNLQKAAVNRMNENRNFQASMSDQLVTASVLTKALERLSQFYKDELFIQIKKSVLHVNAQEDAPPPQKEYKKSSASTGLLVLLKKLILDAEDLIKESRTSEREAQAAYEETAADTFESIAELQRAVQSKTKAKAETNTELQSSKLDKDTSVKDLGKLAKVEQNLHKDCDELLKNFEVRQKARSDEVEALQQSLSILDGAAGA